MSAYSDYKVGAISYDEYKSAARMEETDRPEREPKKTWASVEIEFNGSEEDKKAFIEYALGEFNHKIEEGVDNTQNNIGTKVIRNNNENLEWDSEGGYLFIEEKANYWVEDCSPYGSYMVCDFIFDSEDETKGFINKFTKEHPDFEFTSFEVSAAETKQYINEKEQGIDLD